MLEYEITRTVQVDNRSNAVLCIGNAKNKPERQKKKLPRQKSHFKNNNKPPAKPEGEGTPGMQVDDHRNAAGLLQGRGEGRGLRQAVQQAARRGGVRMWGSTQKEMRENTHSIKRDI